MTTSTRVPQTNNLQVILDHLTAAVLLVDQNLCIRYMNPASEMLLDTSNKRACGLPLDDFISGDANFIERLFDAVKSGQSFTVHETTLKTSAGREITADYTATRMLQSTISGEALLIEISRKDRHLRIAQEETLLLQHQVSRNLIKGLAHEIKNPLGGLRGAAQLLERELPSPELTEYTRIIIGEADRLQNLVDRMLGPKNLPHMREVNIHQPLEYVRHLVKAEAPPGINFVVDYDPSLPPVAADPEQLIQALLNITRNAVQALGERGQVLFRTRVERHFIIENKHHRLVAKIEIIDNGPGIPEDFQKQIFYPLVTGRAEGTGLGLSIAQSLINQQGGLVECRSRPKRTVFTICLPLENCE